MTQNYQTYSRNQIRQNYDRLSRIYDLLSGGSEHKYIRKVVSGLEIYGSGNVLDIGCGTGAGLLALSQQFPSAHALVGVDISMGMCQSAVRKIYRLNLSSIPLISQSDALHLPFPADSFQLIFMSFVFELFAESLYPTLCQELWRILSHDGSLSLINIAKSKIKNSIFSLYKWCSRKYPQIIDCRPIDSPSILRANGFRITQIHHSSLWGIPIACVNAVKG